MLQEVQRTGRSIAFVAPGTMMVHAWWPVTAAGPGSILAATACLTLTLSPPTSYVQHVNKLAKLAGRESDYAEVEVVSLTRVLALALIVGRRREC